MKTWMDEELVERSQSNEILSFDDYMTRAEANPVREIRPTYEYLLDMLNFFGKESDGNNHLFSLEHNDAPPVYGQARVLEAIYQNLTNFKEEGFNNKFILLVGPNGSSKSSIVKKFIAGAEEYSTKDDGALFSFSWVFPIENFVKGSLGLASEQKDRHLETFAYLDDKDINAILPSELKDSPLLLIPLKHRRKMIDTWLSKKPEIYDSIKKSYYYNGDLSKRNKMIYDALLKNYKGNHKEVLKHIRVERIYISRRYSTSAVTIEPQLHVDAHMQQITMDKRLASLPPSLQSLNLFSLGGEVVLANRGVLEYSDLLKRPLDTFKYLLQTMETGNINLQGILTALDIFFVGTSNEIHLSAFKQHPDYGSFKGRFNLVTVPYLTNYQNEKKIYQKQVDGLSDTATFEPHAVEALCLFAVFTRLRNPLDKNYDEKKLGPLVVTLNPLEKALLIADKKIPDRFDQESKQILSMNIKEVEREFENAGLYEGKFGISPRDIKLSLYTLASIHKNITFMEVLDHIQDLINKRNDFEFLNMTPQNAYHNPQSFVTLIKDWALGVFDQELRGSLGLVDDRSYEDHVKRYVEQISAMIKKERVKNPITGKYEDHDQYFIKEFEKSVGLHESSDSFRSAVIGRLGAYSLDNPGKKIIYSDVFPDLYEKLQQSFREEQKSFIQGMARNLVFYEAEYMASVKGETLKSSELHEKSRKEIESVLKNLTDKFNYTQKGALTLIRHLTQERY